MSYSVSGTTITLTRGDTFVALISITKQDGTPYVPNDGDKVRFAMKAKYEDPEPLRQAPASRKSFRIPSPGTIIFPRLLFWLSLIRRRRTRREARL